jgi:predicted nucleic acid-binding Zn ribbon protein
MIINIVLEKSQQEFLRSLLSRARVRAASSPVARRRNLPSYEDQRSGAGPDERDPAMLSGLIERLIINKGWDLQVATGKLQGQWGLIVGHDIASHVTIESFNLDPSGQSGNLILRAQTSAWATQIRLLLPTISARLGQEIGQGRISEIKVLGPTAPSWKHGQRSVKGRGPRDTYG